jgi:hypothetical protein
VDFFEVTVDVGGQRQTAWKFLMRLMYSGRDFVWIYERCNQVAFLDGHVRAFQHFGGVPRRGVYDRLSSAIKRKVGLRDQLSQRFKELVSHYLFEPCFARPGEGHDKGGVEGRGKSVRLQHLTPIPRGDGLQDIATCLLAEVDASAVTSRDPQGRSVTERFSEEQPQLRTLPGGPFDPRQAEPVAISRQALVRIEGSDYSVPSHWHSLQAMAFIGVAHISLECRGESITVAKQARGKRAIDYRHYLPALATKPQALRQVASQLMGQLGEPYQQLWSLLTEAHGERDAARAMARLLGAIQAHGQQSVSQALQAILDHREVDPGQPPPTVVAVPPALMGYTIESATAASYDSLLLEAQS